MAILKHIDFQVTDWGEFQQGPKHKPGYRSQVLSDLPLMYLRMGESSGPIALDEVGSRHATEVGVMDWGLQGSLRFDADTAVGSLATGGLSVNSTGWLPTGSGPRTVELWFRPSAATSPFLGISYGSGLLGMLTFVYSSGGLLVSVGTNGFGGTTANLTDQWHHAVFVFPAGASRLDEFAIYVDGAPITMQLFFGSGATVINTNDSPLWINQSDTGTFNNCEIDEVAVYDTALSAQRIKEHYDAAVGQVGQ
jgi:hypothetical protein